MRRGDADLLDQLVAEDLAIGEVSDDLLAVWLEGGEGDDAGGGDGIFMLQNIDVGGFLGGKGAGNLKVAKVSRFPRSKVETSLRAKNIGGLYLAQKRGNAGG